MTRKLVLFFFIASLGLQAQVEFITTSTDTVGPGVIYKQILAPTVPYDIKVLEVDLRNPFIKMETVKARDARIGMEGTSSMAKRYTTPGHTVVGAVNGDFYDTGSGVPINAQVINGEVLRRPGSQSLLGFDFENHPVISRVTYSGTVIANGLSQSINQINSTRYENYLVLYNRFAGASTGTNQWGAEALLHPLGDWIVNDTVTAVIDTMIVGAGSMSIPDGQCVLSGHGLSQTFMTSNFRIGDTLRIVIDLSPSLPKLTQLIGGFPRIVKDGKGYVDQGYNEEGGPSHTYQLHPRTAAGFSADSTILYLITVDGRQASSVGMSLPELAEFMVSIGVYHGINFDGGGSTTMVVQNLVENTPSDGWERSVSNALMVVSSAPQDTLSRLKIRPRRTELYDGESVQFSVTGWDRYYNPIALNAGEVSYSIDENLGSISSSGRFVSDGKGESGFVYVHYGKFIDSAFVHLKGISSFTISPKYVVIDLLTPLQLNLNVVDEYGKVPDLPSDTYQWQSLNPDIVSVDGQGLATGIREGSTEVIAAWGELADSMMIDVEVGDNWQLLDELESTDGWTVSGTNIDLQQTVLKVVTDPRTSGQGAFRLDYSFVRQAGTDYIVMLETDIPVYGVPESIDFEFKSNGARHKLYGMVSDNDDELFRVLISGYAIDTSFTRKQARPSKVLAFEESAQFNFPIRVRGFYVALGTSADVDSVNAGSLYFDKLRVVYPNYTQIVSLNAAEVPDRYNLSQNFPNPFNPQTAIRFEIPCRDFVNLTVFDILGNQVAVLMNRDLPTGSYEVVFDGRNLSSGLYFYTLKSSTYSQTYKMMLLK